METEDAPPAQAVPVPVPVPEQEGQHIDLEGPGQ